MPKAPASYLAVSLANYEAKFARDDLMALRSARASAQLVQAAEERLKLAERRYAAAVFSHHATR